MITIRIITEAGSTPIAIPVDSNETLRQSLERASRHLGGGQQTFRRLSNPAFIQDHLDMTWAGLDISDGQAVEFQVMYPDAGVALDNLLSVETPAFRLLSLPSRPLSQIFDFFPLERLAALQAVSRELLESANGETDEKEDPANVRRIGFMPSRHPEIDASFDQLPNTEPEHLTWLRSGYQETEFAKELFLGTRREAIFSGRLSLKEVMEQIDVLRSLDPGGLYTANLLLAVFSGQLSFEAAVKQIDTLISPDTNGTLHAADLLLARIVERCFQNTLQDDPVLARVLNEQVDSRFSLADLFKVLTSRRHFEALRQGKLRVRNLATLSDDQVEGLQRGFTLDEVTSPTFDLASELASRDAEASQERLNSPVTLSAAQVEGLRQGLMFHQVTSPNFEPSPVEASQGDLLSGPVTLSADQVEGLEQDFTLDDVMSPWFGRSHVKASYNGDVRQDFSVEKLRGLDEQTVQQMLQRTERAMYLIFAIIHLHPKGYIGSNEDLLRVFEEKSVEDAIAARECIKAIVHGSTAADVQHFQFEKELITTAITDFDYRGCTLLYVVMGMVGNIPLLETMRIKFGREEWLAEITKPLSFGDRQGRTPFQSAVMNSHTHVLEHTRNTCFSDDASWNAFVEQHTSPVAADEKGELPRQPATPTSPPRAVFLEEAARRASNSTGSNAATAATSAADPAQQEADASHERDSESSESGETQASFSL